MMQLGHIGKVT